ncbi:MAG TPA: molybdate ABC transporter substrate-binding protein, partial [Candidatus Elarobacter sp.]
MTRLRSLSLIGALAMALASTPPARADAPVVVYAAASLREAFGAAQPEFTKRTGLAVTFSFGGSDTLAAQLRQGAPADVFASADQAQMRAAADAGLLDGTPRTFARNRLVVIYPRANPGRITQ